MLHQKYRSPFLPRRAPRLPKLAPTQRLIDPVAFFVALFGGPILVTLAGFWVAFIPVAALYIGAVPYLVLGTPLLLIYLPRYSKLANNIGVFAMTVSALAALPFSAVLAVWNGPDIIGVLVFFVAFALIFALLWGSAFGWIYNKLERPFYRNTIIKPLA